MKFKYIGRNGRDGNGNEIPVNSYCGLKVLNGETVELNDFFSKKAMADPNYEEVKPKKVKSKKTKEEPPQIPELV